MEFDLQSLEEIDDANAQEISKLISWSAKVNDMSWSSDGDLLALATDEGIQVRRSENLGLQNVILEADWPSPIISSVDFHPSKDLLLFGWSSFFQTWDLSRDEAEQDSYTVGMPVHNVAYSKSGKRLAIAFQGGVLLEQMASNQGPLKIESGIGTQNTFRVLFASEQDFLIALTESGKFYALDSATGALRWSSSDNLHFTGAYAPILDGTKLLAAERDQGILILNTSDGGEASRVDLSLSSPVASLTLHPKGDLAAAGLLDGRIILFEPIGGMKIANWEASPDWITNLSFSPNGKLLLSGSRDGQLKVWGIGIQ